MNGERLFRLRPWLVRALIPARHIGTYILYRDNDPVYVGRSDTDLRRRLLHHAAGRRGDYFSFDLQQDAAHAFVAESSLFHAVGPKLTNKIHPDSPDFANSSCEFCRKRVRAVLDGRLTAVDLHQPLPESENPASDTERNPQ